MSDQESKGLKQSLNKDKSHPILAIDFGDRRVGLAISDMKGIVSTPLTVIQRTKNKSLNDLIEEILYIAAENRVRTIILGLPQSFVEAHNKIREKIKIFEKRLKEKTDIPIIFYDESFSTSTAQNMLLSLGHNSRSTKDKIDMVSAAIFLQEYLDRNKQEL